MEGIEKSKASFKSEGYDLEARVYRPPRPARPTPGILIAPGRNREVDADWIANPIAQAGYLVVSMDYRGKNDVYLKTDTQDIMGGITFLSGLSGVNPEKIGVFGRSRGAMSALITAAQDPRIKAAVVQGLTADRIRSVKGLREYAPSRYKLVLSFIGGTPEEMPEHYKAISPITYADKIKIPVLIVTGSSDLYAPMDHALWMLDALKAGGNNVSKVEVMERTGHFLEQPSGRFAFDDLAKLALSWFTQILPPPAP